MNRPVHLSRRRLGSTSSSAPSGFTPVVVRDATAGKPFDVQGDFVWNALKSSQLDRRSVPQMSPEMLHRIVPGAFQECRGDSFCRCRTCKPPHTVPYSTKLRVIIGMSALLWLSIISGSGVLS